MNIDYAIITDKVPKMWQTVYTLKYFDRFGEYQGYDVINVKNRELGGDPVDSDELVKNRIKEKHGNIIIRWNHSQPK